MEAGTNIPATLFQNEHDPFSFSEFDSVVINSTIPTQPIPFPNFHKLILYILFG